MNKKAFVLWSGGLDSTYLIWKLLQDGYSVRAGYINLGEQSKKELEVIEKLTPLFENYAFTYVGKLATVDAKTANQSVQLKQSFLWLTSLLLMPLQENEKVAMGFVMNDDAISYMDEFKQCAKSLSTLCNSEIELMFPLIKTKKEEIWDNLPERFRTHVVWCEKSHELELPCGECISCKRMKHAKIEVKYCDTAKVASNLNFC